MNYNEALQTIETTKALEALKINYLCEGVYVRFECDCGSEAANFKTNGEKKNLWYCPDCKKGGNILNFTMAKRGTEYEETKRWLLKLSPTTKRITKELELTYELQYTEAVRQIGLSEECCKALEIGVPKGKTMLAGCLTFTVRSEEGVKIAYYGIRLKNQRHIFHKTFNPELYLYGLNLVKDHAILVNDMVKCAKRIGEGEPVISNFGMPYLSPIQCQLINSRLEKVDLEVTPKIASMVATHLKTYYRFI